MLDQYIRVPLASSPRGRLVRLSIAYGSNGAGRAVLVHLRTSASRWSAFFSHIRFRVLDGDNHSLLVSDGDNLTVVILRRRLAAVSVSAAHTRKRNSRRIGATGTCSQQYRTAP